MIKIKLQKILENILYWAFVLFIFFIIFQLIRKIIGGSWGLEAVICSLVVTNIGFSFYLTKAMNKQSLQFQESLNRHYSLLRESMHKQKLELKESINKVDLELKESINKVESNLKDSISKVDSKISEHVGWHKGKGG